ncbi:MAG: MerR family transcriptional regulator [Clostridia bacterium]|nr:MerR family transcriptional regulator [Clostridia bacterium]
MQIGEFARICDTKVSVLRHYDKEGLLIPDYVDNFTGYRYYSKEQIPIFVRITALKQAGFTLPEIKTILSSCESREQILSLFESKKSELLQTMANLTEAEKIILEEHEAMSVTFYEKNRITYAKSELCDANLQNQMRNEVEKAILENGYQRISVYKTCGNEYSNQVYVTCEVVKLSDSVTALNDDVNIAFEDDSSIVGKWQTVGEYAVKEDFYGNICPVDYVAKEIYFLPHGERYWCYSWSKGKLICEFGDASAVNDYVVEDHDGSRYMFVTFKSYEYRRNGKPTVLVLRQIDNVAYSAEDIARKDNIELSFVNDRAILGTWEVKGFCRNIEAFDPSKAPRADLFFKQIVFKENGEVISVYGNMTVCGAHMQTWTKGFVLRKWNNTACAYQLCQIDGEEYLFVEWKSGDYTYGGLEPQYYVFTRALK